jgi:Carboxypeptidase regulatory-like domain
MRGVVQTLTLVAWVVLLPAAALAQAVIAGTVRDPSGAVLPGVTVEATSPVLIEKVRSAVTDGTGLYRIEDLRPGTYTVTFSLPGFNTFKREGIELTGSFTATINVELKVGELTETIVVSGESPVVDVQSARREVTLKSDVLQSIPSVRSYNALVVVVPGVVTNLNDTVTGTATTQFPIHGGRNNEGRMTIDGLNIGNPVGGNQPPQYTADIGNSQEVTFQTSGGLGESENAGLVMNVVPKTGGNSISGAVYFSGTGEKLQSDNFTQEIKDAGLAAPTPYTKVYDFNAAFGGPIMKDRVWYFVNGRTQGSTRNIANIFYNKNAGDPTKWTYDPDSSRPAYSDRTWENVSGRVTWQATSRDKIGAFWDEQRICRKCDGMTQGITDPARVSPEAIGVQSVIPMRVNQITWSSPRTNRLLLDAGYGGTYYGAGNPERPGNATRDFIRVVEQCASGCTANGNIPNMNYRSQDWGDNFSGSYNWRASAAYVTGAHSMKVGYQGTYLTSDRNWQTNNENLTYRLNNGVPNQLTQSISPWIDNSRAGWHALFVQEQWTRRRLTLQGALRFDRASSWFPEQTVGPSRFLPTAITFPETKGVDSYNDITPRMGVAYDVFGNGKTALKFNLGKYLEGVGVQLNYINTNPILRMPRSTSQFGTAGVTRTWIDANANFQPDCDLMNPLANDRRSSGGDFCGQMSNLNFGQKVLSDNYDPDLLTGWGVRASDWSLGLSVQQQILPRMSIEVAYHRRWFNGFTLNDNLLTTSADYAPYSVTAPVDPRLPGGGGYVIPGLFDVSPALAGQINNLAIDSHQYGKWYQYFNGVDVTLNVRTGWGLTVQGGTSTGQNVADNCAVRASLPELNVGIGAGLVGSNVSPTSPYCHVGYGVLTQLRGLGTYTIPKIDLQLSGVFQSKPGALLSANYAVPAAVVAQSLGRLPSGNVTNVTVNLIEPGSMYGDRLNQLDFRVAKVLRFGNSKTTVGVDLYNVLNSSAILTYNNVFVPGGPWLLPNSVLTGRLARITAEFTF